MTALPKWWSEIWTKFGYLHVDLGKFQNISLYGMYNFDQNNISFLPKSIPSETFPLATDNKTAPRPFSQAWHRKTLWVRIIDQILLK